MSSLFDEKNISGVSIVLSIKIIFLISAKLILSLMIGESSIDTISSSINIKYNNIIYIQNNIKHNAEKTHISQ